MGEVDGFNFCNLPGLSNFVIVPPGFLNYFNYALMASVSTPRKIPQIEFSGANPCLVITYLLIPYRKLSR